MKNSGEYFNSVKRNIFFYCYKIVIMALYWTKRLPPYSRNTWCARVT